VDRVRDQFLAGAVLALNQDVRFAGRDALDQLEQFLHLLALADHVLEFVAILEFLFQLLVLVDQCFLLDGFLEFVQQTFGIDRFLEEIERPGFDRLDRAWNVALAGDHDHFGLGVGLLELANQFDAVDVGQHHVGDHRVGLPSAEQLVAARTDKGRLDLSNRRARAGFSATRHRRLIIDGEYAFLTLKAHGL
jgi:hypothetical protein